jgi:hypothetical protein
MDGIWQTVWVMVVHIFFKIIPYPWREYTTRYYKIILDGGFYKHTSNKQQKK